MQGVKKKIFNFYVGAGRNILSQNISLYMHWSQISPLALPCIHLVLGFNSFLKNFTIYPKNIYYSEFFKVFFYYYKNWLIGTHFDFLPILVAQNFKILFLSNKSDSKIRKCA